MAQNLTTWVQVRTGIGALTLLVLLASAGQVRSQEKRQSIGEVQESRQLLAILRDEEVRRREPERVAEAIERLGEIRFVEAIPDLIQLLTFERNVRQERVGDVIVGEHFITMFARYPAAGSLFRIGKPALPALIRVIEVEERESRSSENAIYTVIQIFRDAPSEGVQYLRDAVVKVSSAQAADRLSGAAEKMKRFLQQ